MFPKNKKKKEKKWKIPLRTFPPPELKKNLSAKNDLQFMKRILYDTGWLNSCQRWPCKRV